MKERPILFSSPMVRAILEGRQTVTRRIVEGTPEFHKRAALRSLLSDTKARTCTAVFGDSLPDGPVSLQVRCPYGFVDRLWVKETWRPRIAHGHGMDACDCADVVVRYEADRAERYFDESEIPDEWSMPKAAARGNVSPLFMPRWASRITLEIVDVRCERLHDITEEDSALEGVTPFPKNPDGDCWTDGKHRTAFEFLWNELHGWNPNAWAANPWVWRIEFRRLQQEESRHVA